MDFKNENGSKERIIKFGVIYSDKNFLAWNARCLQEILSLNEVQLSVLIVEDDKYLTPNEINSKNKKKFSKYSLFLAYKNLISKSNAEISININEIITDIPTIRYKSVTGENFQYFNPEDIETIKKFDLDFILYFGSRKIGGDILNVARYGVWAYHLGDEQKYRGGPPCFWEIYEKNPITVVALKRLTDSFDKGIILKRGCLKTSRSYARNIDNAYFAAVSWPAQVIKEILNGSAGYFGCQPVPTSAPNYADPTNLQMIFYLERSFLNYIIYRLEKLLIVNQWNVGFVYEPIKTFLDKEKICKINWLPQKKNGSFVADPFAIKNGNDIHLFCEFFNYETLKGEIVTCNCTETNSDMHLKKLDLDVSCHLSYPFLFEYGNNIYMVPESSEVGKIFLYKAIDFPEKWKKVMVILDNVKAVDSTIFQYQDMWWLAYSDLSFGMHNNLYLWYALNPLEEWKPHELNPVKIDVRSSRGAGTPFIHNGILYRPSQDCSEKYGGKISINRVKKLTPYEFEEEVIKVIEPCKTDLYSDGRHTISLAGDITIIDGHRSVFIGHAILQKLLNNLH